MYGSDSVVICGFVVCLVRLIVVLYFALIHSEHHFLA